MGLWTEQRTGGTAGPAGPPGPSGGSSTPAPQVSSATQAIFYSNGMFGYQGVITLPTGDPNYAHLRQIVVTAVSPAGVSYQIASLVSSTTYPTTPFSGSTIAYSGLAEPQPSSSSSGWSLTFQVYNEVGAPTLPPYTISGLTVYAYLAGSVSAVETYTYDDPGGGLHEAINVTVTVASTAFLPATFNIWLQGMPPDTGTWYNQGLFTLTAVGGTSQTFLIGQMVNGQGGFLWAPTDGTSTSWTVAVALGSWGDTPPTIAVTDTFSVTGATACLSTDVTSLQFLPNPSTGSIYQYSVDGNSQAWDFYAISLSLPSPAYDPSFVSCLITVQKGQLLIGTATVSGGNTVTDLSANFTSSEVGLDVHVGGVLTTILSVTSSTVFVTVSSSLSNGSGVSYDLWVPAPDYEGANTAPIPGTYQGRAVSDFANPPGTVGTDPGTSQQLNGSSPPNWTYPPALTGTGAANPYRTFRFICYAISRLLLYANVNGSGTYTRQIGWPGGADCGYLTPNAGASVVNGGDLIPSTLGSGVHVTVGQLALNYGAALADDGSGKATVTIDTAQPFTTVSGKLAIGPGTAMAGGTLTFGYTTSGAYVQLGSAGLTLADNYTSPVNTVAISSSGISIENGGTNKVTVTSAGVGVYGPSGSLTATSGGIAIVNGSTSLSVTSSQLQLIYSGVSSLTVSSTGISMGTVGGPVISISTSGSGAITIQNYAGTNYFQVTPTQVSIVNGTYSVLMNGSQIQLNSGGSTGNPTLTLTASSLTISNNQSGSSAASVVIGTSSVTINNGTLNITSGTVTVEVDSTNYVKVSDSSSVFTGQLSNTGLQTQGTYIGVQYSGGVTPRDVQMSNLSTGVYFGFNYQGMYATGGATGFTGTLTAAIAAGKNVVGGFIAN